MFFYVRFLFALCLFRRLLFGHFRENEESLGSKNERNIRHTSVRPQFFNFFLNISCTLLLAQHQRHFIYIRGSQGQNKKSVREGMSGART